MTNCEKLLDLIGEFIFTEIKEIKKLTYIKNQAGEQTSFIIQTDDGKEFVIEIKKQES